LGSYVKSHYVEKVRAERRTEKLHLATMGRVFTSRVMKAGQKAKLTKKEEEEEDTRGQQISSILRFRRIDYPPLA
jgi:hypothetical protein